MQKILCSYYCCIQSFFTMSIKISNKILLFIENFLIAIHIFTCSVFCVCFSGKHSNFLYGFVVNKIFSFVFWHQNVKRKVVGFTAIILVHETLIIPFSWSFILVSWSCILCVHNMFTFLHFYYFTSCIIISMVIFMGA